MKSPGIKFKLGNYEELKAMIHFFRQLVQYTERLMLESGIYQTDLYHHILSDLLVDKLAMKLLKQPDKYHIKLNHIQCLAFHIVVMNETLDLEDRWLQMTVQRLLNEVDQYLINNSDKIRWQNNRNYQLESSTSESSLLIDSSKKLN